MTSEMGLVVEARQCRRLGRAVSIYEQATSQVNPSTDLVLMWGDAVRLGEHSYKVARMRTEFGRRGGNSERLSQTIIYQCPQPAGQRYIARWRIWGTKAGEDVILDDE